MREKWNDIISRLHGIKPSGSGYIAKCPAHDDNQQSLSISLTEDRILVKCHAGCEFDEIVSALNLKSEDFFSCSRDDEIKKTRVTNRTIYVYKDINGNRSYGSERVETECGKSYKKVTWIDGKWAYGLKDDVQRIPYRLDELIKTDKKSVFIVEGEKVADALCDIGCIATTSDGGPSNLTQWMSFGKYFENFDKIYILPDNDAPGWKYAQAVKSAIGGTILDVAYEYERKTGKRLGIKGDIEDVIEKLGKNKTLELLRDAAETEKEIESRPKEASIDCDPEDLLDLLDWDALDAVCPNIREMCEVYAEFTQSEPHIILGAFMTATAGLAQRFIRGVQMNRNWREAISMFSVFVADSGRNKSGVVRLFGKPLDDICKKHNQSISESRIEWEAQYAMAKMRRKNAEKDAEKDAGGDFWKEQSAQELIDAMKEIKNLEDEQPRPINSIMTQDTTVEALVKALYFDKMSSGIIWSHEIKKLFTIILGEYKRGAGGHADDTSLITAYDNDTISVSRKGVSRMDEPNEKIDIYDSSLSIFGGIQTAVFDKIRSKGNMSESGFLGRFMFWIDSNPDPMKIILDSDETNERFDKWEGFVGTYMQNLFDMGEDRYNTWKQTGINDEVLRQTIKMSEEAKKYHAELYNEKTWDERKRGGDLWSENGWFGKIHGMHVRIAAVLYIMRCIMTSEDIMQGEIGVEEVKAAESITLYEAAIARIMLEKNEFEKAYEERGKLKLKQKVRECIKYMYERPVMFDNGLVSLISTIAPLESMKAKDAELKETVISELYRTRLLLEPKDSKIPGMAHFNRKGYEIAMKRAKERRQG